MPSWRAGSNEVMPSELIVREERPSDVAAIFAVHAAAFPSDAEARLVDALRAADHLSVSLVAELDGEVVGHASFSPVTLGGAHGGLGLAPVSVRDSARQQGVAAALIRDGLARCEQSGADFAVVLGDPAYYGRFGFKAAALRQLQGEYGGGAAFQVLEFRADALPAAGGLVKYAPAFEELE